ncbi:MAG: AAA family ATPase, partial [Saprospiraceae bacterium]
TPPLPIGIQGFRTIREDGYKYIDKTQYIHRIATNGKYYFLSRPRRFGKSITLSTLHELYTGCRELFHGLWIEDKWDWNKKHPVIHITLTGSGYPQLTLTEALNYKIGMAFSEAGLPPVEGTPGNRFESLITQLSTQGRVVVLIDEYDAPIIHHLGKDTAKAIEARETLREFYGILKNNDNLLELVFITGVSKFSKVGIFSGLNNLEDLTLHPSFATMLGYTQQELEDNFAEELEQTATQLKLSKEQVLEQMRLWYNGYRFEADAQRVYNPVSCNLFLSQKRFYNFWFATGTPTFLVQILKQEGMFDLHFPAMNLNGFESFDLERLKPVSILFQTGYLTIQSKDEDGLVLLDYPNKEVRDSMLEVLIEGFVGVDAEFSSALIIKIRNAFRDNNLEAFVRILQGVFKGLPYFLHERYPEKFFHAAIHLLFSLLNVRIRSEVCTSDGRVDSVVETDSHVYILEYKLDESAAAALEQIRRKQYYQAFWQLGKPVVGVGINFSSETKNIADWKAEIM